MSWIIFVILVFFSCGSQPDYFKPDGSAELSALNIIRTISGIHVRATIKYEAVEFRCNIFDNADGCWSPYKIRVLKYQNEVERCSVILHELAHQASFEIHGHPDMEHEIFSRAYSTTND